MRFFCIGDEDAVRGFRLAGIEGRAVSAPGEAPAALEAALADPAVGVLVVAPAAARLLRARLEGIRRERTRPLVVEL